eukprot:CAMPEP_0201114356 /NCGR_PEP_ID=MMETSP0812-20130820/78355_1 /ASSEMBLY_ACC=CAM_ASM_000668 /TAXON_ID=98059 /ORGANISM="Dinobryon sp., Strain UTEXLB2267" /LENGTH=97 /DNA_ID=CAMNT_0047377989 /DNA_START=367 /DNA_END=660 /DNA_ORIENTATION=-
MRENCADHRKRRSLNVILGVLGTPQSDQPYSAAVDMWSIFAELLGMMRENCADHRKRRSLNVILGVLGTPQSDQPMSHLDEKTVAMAKMPIRPPTVT